jgi:actin-related protein
MADELILVVDIGSSSVKAGYSGEDIPPYVFPSTLAKGYSSTTEVLKVNSR